MPNFQAIIKPKLNNLTIIARYDLNKSKLKFHLKKQYLFPKHQFIKI